MTITLSLASSGGPPSSTPAALSWPNVPSVIEANQSSTNLTTFTLVNNGTTSTSNVSINLTGLDSSWYNITPNFISNVSGSSNNKINVTFNIPTSASLGDYNLTINASGSITASKNFTLRVVPYVQQSTETNATAWAAIQSANATIIQAQQKGLNVSSAVSKFNSALDAYNSGNFTLAKQQAVDAQTDAQNVINAAPAPNPFQIPQWVYDNFQLILIAGVGILVLAIAAVAVKKRGHKNFSDLRNKLDTFKRTTY